MNFFNFFKKQTKTEQIINVRHRINRVREIQKEMRAEQLWNSFLKELFEVFRLHHTNHGTLPIYNSISGFKKFSYLGKQESNEYVIEINFQFKKNYPSDNTMYKVVKKFKNEYDYNNTIRVLFEACSDPRLKINQ